MSRIDAKSNSANREYDVLGRLVSETDRTNATTTYDYNLNGKRTLQTDAESKATAWAYNAVGQRTSMTYSDAGVQAFTHNAAGTVLTKTLPSGRVHEFTVDSFQDLVTQVDYKNSTGTITNTEAFTFDDMGRQTNVSSSQYSVSSGRTYDDYGRLDEESTTYSGHTYTVSYGYNDQGQRTSLTYPSGDVTEYGYNNRKMLNTISWESNQLEVRDYNANGLLTSVDRAFEDETRTYDDASRLTSISSTNTGSMTYTYDANDNVLSETLSGVMAPYSFTTEKAGAGTYADGYDHEDRFMRYIRAGVNEDILLGRSGIGNVLSSTLNGGSPTNRTYDNAHAITSLGSATQTYDTDGNATTLHTGVTVDWDDAGRVESTHVSSAATAGIEGDNEYGYLDGRKVWRKITRSSNVVSHEVYVYDGPNRIADYNASSVAGSPNLQRVYDGAIDNLRAIIASNGDVFIPTRNRQWSIVSLTENASGSVVERYAYDKFGKRTIYAVNGSTVRTSSSYSNDYGYTGQEELPESGLDYFKARHYDAATGEFLSKDRLLFVDGMSTYRGYFLLTSRDPYGTLCECRAKNITYDGIIFHPSDRGSPGSWDSFNEALMELDKFERIVKSADFLKGLACPNACNFAETVIMDHVGEGMAGGHGVPCGTYDIPGGGFGATDLIPIFEKWKKNFRKDAHEWNIVVKVQGQCCNIETYSFWNPCGWFAGSSQYESYSNHTYYHKCSLTDGSQALPNPNYSGVDFSEFNERLPKVLIPCIAEAMQWYSCNRPNNYGGKKLNL